MHHVFQHISTDDYARLLELQGGVCAICGNSRSDGKRLCVDHNHQTSEVRGLLCFHCNSSLGNFRDDKSTLRNALKYLDNHTGVYLSDKPIRNKSLGEIKIREKRIREIGSGRGDWRCLSDADKLKIAKMKYTEVMAIYNVEESTAFAWLAKFKRRDR